MAYNALRYAGGMPAIEPMSNLNHFALLRQGEQDAVDAGQRDLRRQVGGRMAAGDMRGAMQTAYAGGDLAAGSDIHGMIKGLDEAARARLKQQVEELGAAAEAAHGNPQVWAQTLARYKAQGMKIGPEFEGPDGPKLAMALAGRVGEHLTPYQEAELALQNKRLALEGHLTPYQEAELALQNKRLALEGQMTPYQQEMIKLEREKMAGQGAGGGMTAFDKSYDRETGRKLADFYSKTQDSANDARTQLGSLSRFKQLVQTPGIAQGPGSEYMMPLRRVGAMTGLGAVAGDTPEAVANSEEMLAIRNQLALAIRNPQGAFGMPGAMSDQDREFLQRTVPTLSNTPEGNRQLIDYMTAFNQRRVDIANMANDYAEKNGRLDARFLGALQRWADQNPIFGAAPAAPASAPAAGGGGTGTGLEHLSDDDILRQLGVGQ